MIEPASREPNHRGLAHHGLLLVVIPLISLLVCSEAERLCRETALRLESQSEVDATSEFKAGCLRFVAGFCWGAPAGYLSHLALDATSKKSLPGIGSDRS